MKQTLVELFFFGYIKSAIFYTLLFVSIFSLLVYSWSSYHALGRSVLVLASWGGVSVSIASWSLWFYSPKGVEEENEHYPERLGN